MILAQGRFWRAQLRKDGEAVVLSTLRESLPESLDELRDLKIELPVDQWHRVVKHLRADRKLLGGILLDYARSKELLSVAIANDRLFHALQDVVGDATTCLVEEGVLTLVPARRES